MSSVGIRKVWNVAVIWCGVLDIRLDVEGLMWKRFRSNEICLCVCGTNLVRIVNNLLHGCTSPVVGLKTQICFGILTVISFPDGHHGRIKHTGTLLIKMVT